MSKLGHYNIAFRGLAQASYELDFEINSWLIEHFDGPSQGIVSALGKAVVGMTVGGSSLSLDFAIDAVLRLECDICLEPFEHRLVHQQKLFVKLGEESDDQLDDVIIVGSEVQELNVAQFIYEYLNYGLPIKRTHPPNPTTGKPDCKPEMLELLAEHSVFETEDEVDPRWEALRKLKEN